MLFLLRCHFPFLYSTNSGISVGTPTKVSQSQPKSAKVSQSQPKSAILLFLRYPFRPPSRKNNSLAMTMLTSFCLRFRPKDKNSSPSRARAAKFGLCFWTILLNFAKQENRKRLGGVDSETIHTRRSADLSLIFCCSSGRLC